MSLRIVSGVLRPTVPNGNATIELRANSIIDGDATIFNACEYGGNTHYDREPISAISIRRFDGNPDRIDLSGPSYSEGAGYNNAQIYWNCSGGEVKEITYFFAGEE